MAAGHRRWELEINDGDCILSGQILFFAQLESKRHAGWRFTF